MNVFITAFLLALIYDIASVGSIKTNYIRHHLGSRTPYRFRANKNDSRIKYPSKLNSFIPLFYFVRLSYGKFMSISLPVSSVPVFIDILE